MYDCSFNFSVIHLTNTTFHHYRLLMQCFQLEIESFPLSFNYTDILMAILAH